MEAVNILLIDDEEAFVTTLQERLEMRGFPARVALDGQSGLDLIAADTPDVVVLDLRMPGMSGVEATRRLRGLVPEARVLVLTTFEDDDEVLAAIEAGAAGYMLKASPAEKLVEAICTVMRGGSPLEPSVASKVMAELARLSRRQSEERCQRLADPLSTRELEVLRALCEGLSNKEIAAKLGLTEGTVKNHMTQVLSKLGVLDRTQAALRAHALGLLKPGV